MILFRKMRVPLLMMLITVAPAFCDSIFTIDTSSLIGNPNGPFTVDFQLIDGSGTNLGTNTVTVSNFSDPSALALVSGSESGGVNLTASPLGFTLTDSAFFSDIQFTLTPDSTLSFDLGWTQTPDAGTPDAFIFDILDGSLNNIPTTNPNNGIAFIEVDLPTTNPNAATQVITSGSSANSDNVTIGVPTQSSSVPEPSSVAIVALGGGMTLLTALLGRKSLKA